MTTNSATNVNKRNGDPPANRDELVQEWRKHFEDIFNNSSYLVDTPNISEVPLSNFTKEELIIDNHMKNNKLPGSHEAITAEVSKYGGDSLHSAVLEIANEALNQKETPKEWHGNIIIPILKKASKHIKDFKGVTIMFIAEKRTTLSY